MTLEEKLREMILKRYHSMREFSARIDVPNSTVESILKRGVQNSSVSNVIKLCKGLNISVEALAEGRIEPVATKKPIAKNIKVIQAPGKIVANPPATTDVYAVIDGVIKKLTGSPKVTLNGQTVKPHDVDSIVDAMRFGVKMVSNRQNKED